ncbi:MAG: IS30 family transposase [Motiliproteus sp.]|jgi:IS30 family transposase
MTAALNAPVYLADPYCSRRRGLNENTNGLLRQCWPKSSGFKAVTIPEVDAVIVQLNSRFRKTLEYDTPAKLIAEHMAADAAWAVMHFGVESACFILITIASIDDFLLSRC